LFVDTAPTREAGSERSRHLECTASESPAVTPRALPAQSQSAVGFASEGNLFFGAQGLNHDSYACPRARDRGLPRSGSSHYQRHDDPDLERGLTTYTLRVTVTNLGSSGQRSNVLQSVEIRLDGAKNGEKGLPPLAAGAKYTFPYDVQRATDAAASTTTVDLHLVMHQPSGVGAQDCSAANDSQHVKL
jgi:hypothetical protein